MTEHDDPFKDLKDPFVPETVRIPLGDGTDAVDLGATAMNHAEAMLPKIDSSVMHEGDVLEVEFDNDHQETFEITSVKTGSLVFGSEEITDKQVAMRRVAGNKDEQPVINLYGSAISPSGMMRTPGIVRVGSFMMTDEGVSTGAIRTFDLKRPDENGDLQPVMLNKTEARTEADSFSHAKQTFKDLEELLAKDGFRFGDEDESGLFGDYTKVTGDVLVHAARQGFGCAVTPQDEIYVYDAKAQVLRGLRNIPTEGVFQAMIVEGVSKEIFQEAFIAYRDGSIPDWRYPLTLGRSGIHKLSDFAPVISYTWLSPDQETPTVTVLEDGERVSRMLKTPKQKGAAFVENMKAHGGEDLIDSVHQTLGIDPHDSSHIYASLEVNINPGEQPKSKAPDAYLYGSHELAEAASRKVNEALSVTYAKGYATLDIDGHKIRIETDLDQEIDKMAKTGKLAISKVPKAIGSRLLGRLQGRSNKPH